MLYPRTPLVLWAAFLAAALAAARPAAAQTAHPALPAPAAAASTAADTPAAEKARTDELAAILDMEEPGAQERALEGFAAHYPAAPETPDVYDAIIKDATALNDSARVLEYNEKLVALDPTDMGQRIKTLNLLLLETDEAHRARARREADELANMVSEKAAEGPPAEMGEARWELNLARLRALAALFQGSAAQAVGDWAPAETYLLASLNQSQTVEAAEHLAAVYTAENKLPQALDAYTLALALPGDTIAGRAALRAKAGELYRGQHGGSEAGLGDLILRRFDEVANRDAADAKRLAPVDPNAGVNANAKTAAAFRLTAIDGATHTLGDYAGKVVVVDFWATWCAPCLDQHPLFEELRHQYANNPGVVFISVNMDEDRDKIKPFLAAHGWDNSSWLDAGLGGFWGIESLPTTLILNPAGAVVFRGEGLTPGLFEQQIEDGIAKAISN